MNTEVKTTTDTNNKNAKTFELREPITTGDGRTLTSITLRRGKVRDMRQAQRGTESSEEYELALIASLTAEKIVPEDLDGMDMDDYADIQDWFRNRKTK